MDDDDVGKKPLIAYTIQPTVDTLTTALPKESDFRHFEQKEIDATPKIAGLNWEAQAVVPPITAQRTIVNRLDPRKHH